MKTIRPFASNRRRQRGSILVVCMVMAGLGTVGAAAFFSLIQAKTMETLERETAMNRRIRLANSRALAKEALLRDHLGANTVPAGGTVTYSLPGGWGEANISQHLLAPLAVTATSRLNKTGFIQPTAFNEDIAVSLSDGNSNITYQAQAKSYHPALGGDLLVVHRPPIVDSVATQITGTLNVKGRAVFHDGNYSTTASPIRTDRILKVAPTRPPTSMLNTTGAAILPDNGALPRTTEGIIGATAEYGGRYRVNANPDATVNDYAEMVTAKGGIPLPGTTPYITTEGAATVAPNGNDAGAMTLINAASSPFDSSLPINLRAMRPLSSAVIQALLAKATIVDTTHVKTVLLDNSPLPRDVLTAMLTSTALSNPDLWEIIYANPVGIAYDGDGTLYVDLDSTAATHVSINTTGPFQNIRLRGQITEATFTAAGTMSPLIIALIGDGTSAAGFGNIQFDGENNRPLVFAATQSGPHLEGRFVFNGPNAFPRWRGIFDISGMTMVVVNSAGVSSATLNGGIRTDRSIDVNGGLTIEREKSASAITALQNVTTRTAWVEIYNLP